MKLNNFGVTGNIILLDDGSKKEKHALFFPYLEKEKRIRLSLFGV